MNAAEAGRRMLTRAMELDLRNQAALACLVELDLEANRVDELAEHVRRLVATRRPPASLLRAVQKRLGSDLYLFSSDARSAEEAVRMALEVSGAMR